MSLIAFMLFVVFTLDTEFLVSQAEHFIIIEKTKTIPHENSERIDEYNKRIRATLHKDI